jgi:large subunit ribosomal protein L23
MRDDEIIIRPLMTEKSTKLREQDKYLFVVHNEANKIMVENALKRIFNITPISVNIINIKGKRKRVRAKYGYTSDYKKAVVTVKKGEKIAIFEGA